MARMKYYNPATGQWEDADRCNGSVLRNADWNQMENRPFYDDRTWVCVQEPQTIEVAPDSGVATGEVGYCVNFDHFLHKEYPEGTIFKLIVGDDDYIGTYKARGGGFNVVGNASFYFEDGEDTGEDFCVCYYGVDSIAIFTRKPLTVCEVSVYMLEGGEIRQLDEKFIPDSIARTGDVPDAAEVVERAREAICKKAELINHFVVDEDVQGLEIDRDSDGNPLDLSFAVFHLRCGDDVADGNSGAGVLMFYADTGDFIRMYTGGFKYHGYEISAGKYRVVAFYARCDLRDGIVKTRGYAGDTGDGVLNLFQFTGEDAMYLPDSGITRVRASFKIPKNAKVWLYGIRRDGQ